MRKQWVVINVFVLPVLMHQVTGQHGADAEMWNAGIGVGQAYWERREKLEEVERPTPFQLWLEQHGGQASLEGQVALAQRLYNQGEQVSDDTPVDKIVADLRSSPLIHDSFVRWKGIHVEWLLTNVFETNFFRNLIDFGCEVWFVRKVCVNELLRRRGILSGPLIDHVGRWTSDDNSTLLETVSRRPTAFISYTGRFSLRVFVDILRQLKDDHVWLDILCVDQFMWTGRSRSKEMKPLRRRLSEELSGQIETIHNTVLMLDKWKDVMATLGQTWVLWEIYSTFEANARFRLLLPPQQRGVLIDQLLPNVGTASGARQSFHAIVASLSSIDVTHSVAESDDDRQVILHLMERKGLTDVNRGVMAQMRSWLAATVRSHIEWLRSNHGHTEPTLMNNFGALLEDLGYIEEASDMYLKAYDRMREMYGPELYIKEKTEGPSLFYNTEMINYRTNYARSLARTGDLETAATMFREIVSQLEVVHSFRRESDKERILQDARLQLAETLGLQGKGEEALQILLRVDQEGGMHDANYREALGSAFLRNGELAEAQNQFERVVAERTKEFGPNDPLTLSAKRFLARVLLLAGAHFDAVDLFSQVYETNLKRWDAFDFDMVEATLGLAEALHQSGSMKEAERLYREAIPQARQISLRGDANRNWFIEHLIQFTRFLEQGWRFHESLPLRQEIFASDILNIGIKQVEELEEMVVVHFGNIEAEKQFRFLLLECEFQLGYEDYRCMMLSEKLMKQLDAQRKMEEVAPLMKRLWNAYKKKEGADSPLALRTGFQFGLLLMYMVENRYDEGHAIAQHTWARMVSVLGPDHWATLESYEQLAPLRDATNAK